MNTCKTCKHWKRNNDAEWYLKANMEMPKSYLNFGECYCRKFVYGESTDKSEIYDEDCLLYHDYEDWKAGFETGEDFGCLHYDGT